MFTGIIEGLGTITGIQPSGMGKHFTIDADFDLDRLKIGDSVAVNGACLTAVKAGERRFEVDVAPETLSLTTFSQARIGDRVNLERALRLSDRLDGHLVSDLGVGVVGEVAGDVIVELETAFLLELRDHDAGKDFGDGADVEAGTNGIGHLLLAAGQANRPFEQNLAVAGDQHHA